MTLTAAGSVETYSVARCPKAKMLAGSWHCPCCGIETVPRPRKQHTRQTASATPRKRGFQAGKWDDEMADMLVKVLEGIADTLGV